MSTRRERAKAQMKQQANVAVVKTKQEKNEYLFDFANTVLTCQNLPSVA